MAQMGSRVFSLKRVKNNNTSSILKTPFNRLPSWDTLLAKVFKESTVVLLKIKEFN